MIVNGFKIYLVYHQYLFGLVLKIELHLELKNTITFKHFLPGTAHSH